MRTRTRRLYLASVALWALSGALLMFYDAMRERGGFGPLLAFFGLFCVVLCQNCLWIVDKRKDG